MASGCLQLTGTISLTQFWPEGSSDADTIQVQLGGWDAFEFQDAPGAPFITTYAFDQAWVQGRARRKVIREGRVTVRLEGVDAPELHYAPDALLPGRERTLRQVLLYLAWHR